MDITFRAVIEVVGKPQEHVEKTIKHYIQQLKDNDEFTLKKESFADIKPQEGMFSTFAEVEVGITKPQALTDFCLSFMPAVIEVVHPLNLTFSQQQMSAFLSDLQAKLHNVDAVAKQIRIENEFLKAGMTSLLSNYILVILKQGNFTAEQIGKMTGVAQDRLEDFLDQLIDAGKIDLKGGEYFLKSNATKTS